MDNGWFCKRCGMIKQRCICPEKDFVAIGKIEPSSSQILKLKKLNPEIDAEIIENFPFPEAREGQLEIISDIKNAIDDGFEYIILEAGTGTGKSAIATALCNIFEPAYILTMTKQLQAQYSDEFGHSLMKGRSNFYCKAADLEESCDKGVCQTTPNSRKYVCDFGVTKSSKNGLTEAFEDFFGNLWYFRSIDRCNYWLQKVDAINSPLTLMNYDYALLELNYVRHFGKRRLMVLDEAHNLENKLMRRMEVNIPAKRLEKDVEKTIPSDMLKYEDPADWEEFIRSLYEAYSKINIKDLPKNRADRIKRSMISFYDLGMELEDNSQNWVVDPTPDRVSFKPLTIDGYTEEMLFRHADIRLFMSATILDQKLFCRWLGIDPDAVFSLNIKSPFPASKRPVYLRLAGNMSKRSIKYTAPKTIPILEKIIEHHKYEKGLIHTHNYKCQKYIMENILNNRLISHDSTNREYKLMQFEQSERPLVLVSPSMSEGVDLPYEKCQFQVIYKIPFPYLGDRQINKRRLKDPRWYAYKTVMTLIQAYGRGMRAEDDYCVTYILDGNINMLSDSRMYKNLIPTFFKEAIQDE
ncbi:MAG: ATP-dependent DNA helicase [Euryarchaeota archaeon]|nr:ATP-dependent DNA helicase [Euryarchaeota archaeon]